MKCYAHSRPNAPAEEWQKLEDHLENVANKTAEFAGVFWLFVHKCGSVLVA